MLNERSPSTSVLQSHAPFYNFNRSDLNFMSEDAHYEGTLAECVLHRHSVRVFKDDDVDESLLRECVALAQHAPSNSNMQNWRLHLAKGAARKRVVSSLSAIAREKGPKVPALPEQFAHYRSDFGHKLYGPGGYDISRDEPEKRKAAVLRNYEFFGAPVCGVLTMDSSLGFIDALSVGMFIQTFLLAITERGLGACMQVSVTGYPEVLREEFRLPDDQTILCGIAIGYPAESPVNNVLTDRDGVDDQMILHHE